jgi:queuine/archaeosine tRNA-ribosyltransferase
VVKICDKIRESILNDTFENYMADFMSKYYK